MNAALQDYRTIWRAAVLARDSSALRTLYLVAGAVAACGVILLVLGDLTVLKTLRFMTAIAFMALALIWTFLFMPGAIRLNSPINAWLLPRQRRRLLEMTAAYWLVASLGITFGLGDWAVLPLVAGGTLGLALLMAGNKYVAFLLIVGGNVPWLVHFLVPPAWTEQVTSGSVFLVLDILILPAAVWGLRWLYPAGGDAYLERRADQIKRLNHFAMRKEEKQPVPEGPAVMANLPFYLAMLRRDLKRADPAAMLMHALGPAAHWTTWIGGLVSLLFMGGVAGFLATRSHDASLVDLMTNVGPALLAPTIAFSTARYGQQMRRTPGEQALLRLTPLAGAANLLNRRLATRVLRQALSCWVVLTVVVLGVSLLFDARPEALLRQLALCCVAGQVAMMGLLGDYAAGRGGWDLMLGLRAAAYVLVQALVAMGLSRLTGTTAWPWLIVTSLTVCAVQLRLDWRRMLAAPPAFPAGRMA
jgi:hypothetical protein